MSSTESTLLKNRPKHVGIIMDGNGRWALKRGLPRLKGHIEGGNRAFDVILEANHLNIDVLTLFCFSTENWKRPKEEVNFLMDLMIDFILKRVQKLDDLNIRIRPIGQLYRLPKAHRETVLRSEEKTKNNTGMILNFCMSYGARNELLNVVKSISQKAKNGEISPELIDEETINNHLYTRGLPDPDLIIRTSGEYRISNFLLWQAAYSEFYISETLWPDFNAKEFRKACIDYASRERRFGRAETPESIEPENLI